MFAVHDASGDDVIPSEQCFFAGDSRQHWHGTVFHPYLKPFGYQKCAVCACAVSGVRGAQSIPSKGTKLLMMARSGCHF